MTAGQPQYASANVVASLSGEMDEAFARAFEPIPFTFPRDHGAHPEYKTEWWYYTGNLADETGNQYGYQLTFFRSALTPELPARSSDLATNQIYLAHFAITDGRADRHRSFERYSRGAGGLAGAEGEPLFSVWLEDWAVRESAPGVSRLQATVEDESGTYALDLTLHETRPPLLHGDQGLSQKGPEAGNASYYYSLVNLESRGTLTSAGRTFTVVGQSWMDHEFGTSALSENAVGWDWFSIQLDNGDALMFANVRTADDGVVPDFTGTYAAADGTQQSITTNDFAVTATNQWTSPDTEITYPSGWEVVFPDRKLVLTINPLVLDQEMKVSFIYWEGAVTVEGTAAGAPVQGVGYVELTGYGHSAGTYQR
ncbi:MAG: lipocalin-like domain-containing protein [Caldilineaceae bacterium]